MLKSYKVCKYNLNDDKYKNEWSTVWQSLEQSGRNHLTADYLVTERLYIDVIINFVEKYKDFNLKIVNLEVNYNDETKSEFATISRGLLDYELNLNGLNEGIFNILDIINFYQKALRNYFWGELTSDDGISLVLSNDFYLIITIPENDDLEDIVQGRLFVYDN